MARRKGNAKWKGVGGILVFAALLVPIVLAIWAWTRPLKQEPSGATAKSAARTVEAQPAVTATPATIRIASWNILNLDIVHLDPYPVNARGYSSVIPRDMSYCAGLARRYGRLLVPWMQAHTYGGPGGLQHVSAQDVDRMAQEQWAQGVDAIMWLGWGPGLTFPETRPDSWQRAIAFHRRLAAGAPPKPQARLAVLRPYRTRALSSRCGEQIRDPADWMLQRFLEMWAAKRGQPYDVFELPPAMTPEEDSKLEADLRRCPMVVSTEPRDGAWVIGSGTEGTAADPATAGALQSQFEKELESRGWLRPAPKAPAQN